MRALVREEEDVRVHAVRISSSARMSSARAAGSLHLVMEEPARKISSKVELVSVVKDDVPHNERVLFRVDEARDHLVRRKGGWRGALAGCTKDRDDVARVRSDKVAQLWIKEAL